MHTINNQQMKYASTIIAATVVISMFSCSGFNKLLKSDNVDGKYQEALRYYYKRDYKRAATLFENIMPNMAGQAQEDTVIFYLGNSYYNTKNYELAGELMNMYRNRFSRAPFTEEAEYLHAMSYYLESGDPERDQTSTNQAIVAFNEYLNRHPESDKTEDIHLKIEELTQKLYEKRFINTSLYYKLSHYRAAITSMRSALKDNPEMPQREEMMYLICKSWFDYARKSVQGRQLDRYLSMIDAYYNFKTEYPDGSRYDRELDNMFTYAQNYADMHGTQARELEKNILSIEERKARIENNKNLVYETDDPEMKDELRQKIKDDRAEIRKERKIVKDERKALKNATRRDKPQKLRNRDGQKESVSFDELQAEGAKEYINIEQEKIDLEKEIKREGKVNQKLEKERKKQEKKTKRQNK